MSTMGRTFPNAGFNPAMRQGRGSVGINSLPGTANPTLTPSQAGGIVEADGSLLHNGQASPEILKTSGEIISPVGQNDGFSGGRADGAAGQSSGIGSINAPDKAAGKNALFVRDANNINEGAGKLPLKPYTTSRPKYGRTQVDDVWNAHANPETGTVTDPSGATIVWDRTRPRNGQWDMGHIPGQKYSNIHEKYMNGEISVDEFLKWYRNPQNYRPELPQTNRSHLYEDNWPYLK